MRDRRIMGNGETLIAAVRRLHSRRDFSGDGYGWASCAECRQDWPCATEQAILDVIDRMVEE